MRRPLRYDGDAQAEGRLLPAPGADRPRRERWRRGSQLRVKRPRRGAVMAALVAVLALAAAALADGGSLAAQPLDLDGTMVTEVSR